jgi:lipoate-protein ligase A
MARDAALFEAFERGEIPPTLRLYEWASPAITFGVNQRLPERLVQAAQQLHIPLFRRPTGGKAVLHGHDLTLALVANLPSMPNLAARIRLYPRQVYLALAPAFIWAFQQLGIPASMGDAPAPSPVHFDDGGDCFATSALTDIIHAETGVKLMGCALRVSERGFLMQASIPLRPPDVPVETLFGHPHPPPPPLSCERLIAAIARCLCALL